MALTAKGTPYVVSTDLVANYPTVSSDLADHIDDNLAYNAVTINAQTGSGANAYTFALADASQGKLVTASNAAPATYTVPPQTSVTWAAGAVLRILNEGAGVVTIAAGAGVTLNGSVLTLNQYQYAEIHRTASNTWTVTGIATPPGVIKITDATFSAQSSVSVNNCFSATYDSYRIIVDLSNATSDCDINMRLRVSGSDASGANYYTAGNLCSSAGVTGAFFRDAGTSGLMAGIDSAFPTLNAISSDFINPFTARATRIHVNSSYTTAASVWQGVSCSIMHNLATSYDGFTLFASAGNISGTLRVYGYRN